MIVDKGCFERGCACYDDRVNKDGVEVVKREHEPFIYVREDNEKPFGGFEHCSEADAGAFPVYTAPPKREWVGLTDEEIEQCFVFDWSGEFYANWRKQTYEAIKAKLKEKNS